MRLFIWRHRLYEILEQISFNDFSSRALNQGLIGLIVATLVATILETVPSLAAKYDAAFQTIEIVAAVVFTIEYFLRLWTAIEHGPLNDTSGRFMRDCDLPRAYPASSTLLLFCRSG